MTGRRGVALSLFELPTPAQQLRCNPGEFLRCPRSFHHLFVCHHPQLLRRMIKMDTPLGGGGENAVRGMGRPIEHSNFWRHRPAPGGDPQTHRSATCQGTIKSARMSRLPGAVRRPSSATEMAKGGFATTRNGRRGNRRSPPSVCTTMTWSLAKTRRRSSARVGCNSNAITRAPRRTRGRVSAPEPAPISSTRSPEEIPASSTRRSAHLLSSRCHPHRVRCTDTAPHREHCHARIINQVPSLIGPNSSPI